MAGPTIVSTPPCIYLEWDSKFFGFPIGRVTAAQLTRKTMSSVMAWCKTDEIRCLYFLVSGADNETIRLAEEYGFRLVDIRLTLRLRQKVVGDITRVHLADAVRYATLDDVPALQAIAAASHHDSRFYTDKGFPPHLADALYETWIEKSCRGEADVVLVALDVSRPMGYISCHLEGDAEGRIGLVAVGGEARGKGVGSVLVNSAVSWFAEQGVDTITVVTQGTNVAAQCLYQRCGFLTHTVQLWYHKWFDDSSTVPPYRHKTFGD